MNNKTNTAQGNNVEHLLANSLLVHKKAWANILKSVFGSKTLTALEPQIIGGHKRKTDVEIGFKGQAETFRASIKSFTGSGYNHIERRGLEAFCERNIIKGKDARLLKKIWLRKAVNGGRLVEQVEREAITNIFKQIKCGASAILGADHPNVFALFNIKKNRWHLYNMEKQVIPLVSSSNISFTSQSSNILIGDYVVIQRKGSKKESNRSVPIDSLKHKANDVQIKMRVRKFFNEIKPVAWYQL